MGGALPSDKGAGVSKQLSTRAELVAWLDAASRAAGSCPAYVLSEEDAPMLESAARFIEGRMPKSKPDLRGAVERARGDGTRNSPGHEPSRPLQMLVKWADTAYDGNGARLYSDDEIAAAKDAIARLDRVLSEAKTILSLHRINERDEGHWGDLWCAVVAATAEPVSKDNQ